MEELTNLPGTPGLPGTTGTSGASGTSSDGLDPNSIALPVFGTDGVTGALVIGTNVPVGSDGQPLGQVMTADTMASYLQGLADAGNVTELFNIGSALAAQYGQGADFEQSFLDSADPTNPTIPPILALINLEVQMMKAGNISVVMMSNLSDSQLEELGIDKTKGPEVILSGVPVADASNPAPADAAGVSGPRASGWFAGNAYVKFLESFMEMMRTMMQNKNVMGSVEVQSMNMLVEMAVNTADLIMAVAKQNQTQHITAAVMSAVAIAVTVGASFMGMRQKQVQKDGVPQFKEEPKLDAQGKQMYEPYTDPAGNKIPVMNRTPIMGPNPNQDLWRSISMGGSSLEKMIDSSVQAAQDLSIAEKEGYKEVLQSYRTIVERLLNKAADQFQTVSKDITEWIQTLDSLRQKINEAIGKML